MARRRTSVPEPQDGGSPQEGGAAENPGVASGVGDSQSASDGQVAEPAQPVDLTKFPEFREWQRKQNQQLDALRQQLEQEQRQRQQLSSQFEQQELDRMPEGQRTQYLMEQQQKRLQEMEQTVREYREREARQQALQQISQATGVPIEAFADAPDPLTAAITLITNWQNQHQQSPQSNQQEGAGQAQQGGFNIAPGTRLPDLSRPGSTPHTPFVGPGTQKHSDPTPGQRAQAMFEQYAGSKYVDPAIAHEYVKLVMESGDNG